MDASSHELTAIGAGLVTGVALSAAAGFRVFVPLLVAAIAARCGVIQLTQDFAWLSAWPAIALLSMATLTELLAYHIPAVDHALDVIGTPASLVAGTLLTASLVIGMDDWLRWPLAIIAGGGAATTLHLGKSLARGVSTLTTAGLLNPIIAIGELFASLATTALALLVPAAVIAILLTLTLFLIARHVRKKRGTA